MSDPDVPLVDDDPVIAIDDPLLVAFALQHDLRERFLHALEEIVATGQQLDANPEFTPRDLALSYNKIIEIATKATDEGFIKLWEDEGRPLPWLDERLGSEPEKLRQAVMRMAGLDTDGPIIT